MDRHIFTDQSLHYITFKLFRVA